MAIESVNNISHNIGVCFNFIFDGLSIEEEKLESLKAELRPFLEHLIEVDGKKIRQPIDLITLQIKEDNEIFHILRMMREAVVLGDYEELLPIIATHNRFVTLSEDDEKYKETLARYSSSESALAENERLDELKGAGLIMDLIENIAEAILPFSGLRDSTLKGIPYDNSRLIARSLKALTNLDVLVTNLYKSTFIDSEEARNFLSEEVFKELLSNVINSVKLGDQNLFNPIQLTIKVAHFICLIKDKNYSYIGRNAIKVYALNIIDNLYNPKATNHNVSLNGNFNNIAPSNFEDLGEAVNLLLPILELMNEQEMVKRIKRASVLYNNFNIIKKNKEYVFKSLNISYREAALNMIEAINQLGGEEQNYLDSRIEHIRWIVSDQIKYKEHIQLQNHRAKGIYSLIEKILKYFPEYSKLSMDEPFTVEWLKVVLPKVSDLFGVQLIYNPRMLWVKLFKALNFEEDDDDENKNIESYEKAIKSLKKQLITIFGEYFFEDPRGDDEAKPEIKLINKTNSTLKDFRNLAFILQIKYNNSEIIPVEIQVFFGENAFFLGSYGEASHFMYKLMAMANSNPLNVEQSGILNQSVYEFGAMFMKDDESQNAA